jgi:uncharacterized protein (TIGR02996 family)
MMASPSPELLALLHAAKEQPDDDTPRLVLADWLEEHGDDDRAAFIRVQLALAGDRPDNRQRRDLEKQQAALLDRNGDVWLGPIRRHARSWAWQRGLLLVRVSSSADNLAKLIRAPAWAWVERLAVELLHRPEEADRMLRCPLLDGPAGLDVELPFAAAGTKEGAAALAAALAAAPPRPGLRTLQVRHLRAGGGEALAGSPLLAHVADLRVKELIGPAGVIALASCPHLTNLTRLDLTSAGMGDAGAAALANSAALPRLRELCLGRNDLTDAAPHALASSRHLAGLEVLEMWFNRVSDAGYQALARSPYLTNLRSLHLGDRGPEYGFGDGAARAFAKSRTLGRLEKLVLTYPSLGAKALAALARSPFLGRLDDLEIASQSEAAPAGRPGRAAAAALAGWAPARAPLKRLGLQRLNIGPAGAKVLASSAAVAALERLQLSENGLGPAGAEELAAASGFARLSLLSLANNEVGDAGAKALADRHLTFPALRVLDLNANGIGDEGAVALAGSPLLARLESLQLFGNRIGERGALALAGSRYLKHVGELRLNGNQVTDRAARRLRRRFGERVLL